MNKTTQIRLTLFALLIAITSCNKSKIESAKNEISISTDKKEAKYLAKVAQDNLNVISICEAIEQLDVEPNLKSVIKNIKEEQKAMFTDIKTVASKNIISVASLPNTNFSLKDKEVEADTLINEALVSINETRTKQAILLDTLLDASNNYNIKEIAKNYIETIENNQQLTIKSLERLK